MGELIVKYTGKDLYMELEPVKETATVRHDELDLIITAPCTVEFNGKNYSLDKEGLYKFFDVDGEYMRKTYLYLGDIWYLAGSLSRFHVHGWRHCSYSFEQKCELAKKGMISMTCGPTASFIHRIFSELGITSRLVHSLTLDEWNSYDNGHSIMEIYDPSESSWIFYDSDIGCMLKHKGKSLNFGQVCEVYLKGILPEVIYPAGPCYMDPYTDDTHPKDHAFYSNLFGDLYSGDIRILHHCLRRLMQVPVIDKFFPSDDEEQTARILSYASGKYASYRLSWNDWVNKFYT